MPDEKYTRCPACATVFRVTPQQLSMHAGQVRCGHCKTVFDGVGQQVSLATRGPDEQPTTTSSAGPAPTSTASTTSATMLPESTDIEAVRDIVSEEQDAGPETAPVGTQGEDRLAPPGRTKRRVMATVARSIALLLLILLLAGQVLFHYRDVIAAHVPAARPLLALLCRLSGCTIGPLRDPVMSDLAIDASDLQADPAHKGLLILTATLRSRAGWPLAYPHLELTLTDAQDRVVVRRALAPADYAGGTVDLQRGIPPNGEVALKLFIDASATSQAGYRLLIFYP